MSDVGQGADPQRPVARVHFLDVGLKEYGDAVLCLLGKTSVLIDGAHPGDQVGSPGHPSLPSQLRELLGQPQGAVEVDLLVVTHAHQDHIGCLPTLVGDGTLEARWALVADPGFGWGRPADGSGPPAPPDSRVRNLVAGLREEVLADSGDDRELSRFLADAAALEQRYDSMLTTLEKRGTRVVRYGRDDHKALVRAFRSVGLRILGPSVDQLVLCAEAVANATDAAQALAADLFRQDAGADEMSLYRNLTGGGIDALDASARPGPAINLQSIVTRFELGGVKLLFAGDMQLADPQVGDKRIRSEVRRLRSAIARQAPFSLVKISHHGSDNAFSAETLAELGDTRLFGICAGEESSKHPNATVLRLLDSERDRLDWVRTDRNGLSTVVFAGDRPVLEVTTGRQNDPTPNTPDVVTPPVPEVRVERTSATVTGAGEDLVEVVTRLPHTATRVQVTIEVQPGAARLPSGRPSAGVPDSWSVAGGRSLPPLLFVTSRDALSESVGVDETARLLGAFEAQGLDVFDELPGKSLDSTHAQELVREELRRRRDTKGVVLVGGYDVVPSRVIDCLPAALREQLGQTTDPDDFIVWSDDGFGDLDGGLIPDIPVTRVPDGRSPELLFAALGASDRVPSVARKGVVNVARPFARPIFDALPGTEQLLVSAPLTFDHQPTPTLDAERVYIMLHGDFADASRFWGEGTPGNREAVNLTSIPDPCGRVVFTGCCWGALTVDQPAVRALPGAAPAQKTPSASIALTFLRNGATAFIGCTGAHYSPTDAPFGYFGGPMHEAFWQHAATTQPAPALLAAKMAFVAGFPHGRTTPLQQAIEYKILHEYTCLGLGW